MRDLSTIAFFRAAALLRRNGPVPGILAAQRPGAIMDESGRPRVAISTKPAETTAVRLDPLLQNLTHTTRRGGESSGFRVSKSAPLSEQSVKAGAFTSSQRCFYLPAALSDTGDALRKCLSA